MENVSRAALRLHVSQPALSKQIRDLEDEIGFSLLERTAKSVRLTEAGRAFLEEARARLPFGRDFRKLARNVNEPDAARAKHPTNASDTCGRGRGSGDAIRFDRD